MQSGIYAIINIFDEKLYLGSSKHLRNRWDKHISELNKNRHHSTYLQNAWNLYGRQNFIFVVIEYCEPCKLIEREQYWIDNLDCLIPNGYNLSVIAGSPLGLKRSEETKRKISLAQMGRPPITLQTRLKMSISGKSKVFTDKHKINMAKAQLGRKHSEATKLKISLAAKGKPKSEEHKIKNGLAKQNFKKWPHKGGNRCRCSECRAKINEYQRIRYSEKNI